MMESIKNNIDSFSRVLGSASKIVLLVFALGTNVGLFTGHIDVQVYSGAMMMVLGFYFGSTKVSGTPESK